MHVEKLLQRPTLQFLQLQQEAAPLQALAYRHTQSKLVLCCSFLQALSDSSMTRLQQQAAESAPAVQHAATAATAQSSVAWWQAGSLQEVQLLRCLCCWLQQQCHSLPQRRWR
jgi:hypothetical protein